MTDIRSDVRNLTAFEGRAGGLADKLLALRTDIDAALAWLANHGRIRPLEGPEASQLLLPGRSSTQDESLESTLGELGVIGCMLGLRD
jgi:hypothetical protein